MKRLLAATAILTLTLQGAALADGVALVIGNGAYDNAPTAETAVKDAELVATSLDDAGWTVMRGVDLNRADMRALIEKFAAEQINADEVLVFYSGHALRSGGVTYLAPTDANANRLSDVMFDGVPLELLLRLAARKAGKAVVFIDGAQLRGFRPTPFVEPGLADLEGPEGVMIVSAAAPGRAVRRSRWRESRFARLIVDQFMQPGAKVADVARDIEQPNFVAGGTDADFALIAPPQGVDSPGNLNAEIELAMWRTAERSGRAEDYKAYLARFPDGFFVDFARERLGLKPDGTPVPQEPKVDPDIQTERDLNLSRIRKRKIQEYLLVLGFNPKGIDGLFGRGSRNAIKAWQKSRNFRASSWLTEEQVARLSKEGEAALAEKRRIAEERRRIREAEDNAYWSATGAKGKPGGYRDYLAKYPDGLHSKIARAALAKIAEAKADAAARREKRIFARATKADNAQSYRDYLGAYPEGIYRDQALARLDEIEGAERRAAAEAKYAAGERALRLGPPDVMSIEARLRSLGFEVGKVDGNLNAKSRSGIKGYQASRGIDATGYLNKATVVRLVSETSRVTPAAEGQGVVIDGAAVIGSILNALRKNNDR